MKKTLSVILAVIMLLSTFTFVMPKATLAAASCRTESFTASDSGVKIGTKSEITFKATLEQTGASGLYVKDEKGNKIASLRETAPFTYEGSAVIKADKQAKHTYTLNTSNKEEFTWEMRYYRDLTVLDLKYDERTWDGIKAIRKEMTQNGAENEQILSAVENYLKADDNVASYVVRDNVISFDTVDGVGNVFDVTLTHEKLTQETDIESLENAAAEYAQNTKGVDYIGNKKIGIFAAYYGVEDAFTQCYYVRATHVNEVLGGTVTPYYGSGTDKSIPGVKKCDITAFKDMGNFGLTLVDSHGSLYWTSNTNCQSLICVNYTSGAASSDYSSGRLVKGEDFVGLLAPFITYYNKSYPSSIVYLGSCYGTHTNHLYQAMMNKGAQVVTGYTMSVSTAYDQRIMDAYLQALYTVNKKTSQLNTAKEAFDAAVERYGSTDPYGSESAKWQIKGSNTGIRLCEYHAPVAMESFELSPEEAEIGVGEKLTVKVTTVPAEAIYTCQVVWQSLNDNVATVDEDGVVTGIKKGSALIACQITDRFDNTINKSMEVTVTKAGYTVTFVDGLTGDVIKTQTVDSGKPATAPEAPKHDGYVFYAWDKDFSKVTENMTVTARYFALGDVTLDGVVNTGDATIILRFAAGMVVFENDALKEIGDVVKDGVVNTGDALAVLKMSAA